MPECPKHHNAPSPCPWCRIEELESELIKCNNNLDAVRDERDRLDIDASRCAKRAIIAEDRLVAARKRFDVTAKAGMVDMHGWRQCAVDMHAVLATDTSAPINGPFDAFR